MLEDCSVDFYGQRQMTLVHIIDYYNN